MKKIYLKRWVEVVIVSIQFILFMILGSECDDLKIFIVSKIIALIIFVINSAILFKYSRLVED